MNCEDLLRLLVDYVAGELRVEHRHTVEVHMAGCERCRVVVQTYTHTVRLARQLPRCGPLPPEVEARLRRALEPVLNPPPPA
jgi:anti-sigma factor RsiW